MNRRGFLQAMLAAAAAPAFVRSESLMGLWLPPAPDYELWAHHWLGVYDLCAPAKKLISISGTIAKRIPRVKVISGPGQFSADPSTGILTFNSADAGKKLKVVSRLSYSGRG